MKNKLKQLIRECIKEVLRESYETTIKDFETGEPIEVTIEYEYYTGHVGRRTGMDRFAEPDEPPQVEIHHIITSDGREISLESLGNNEIERLESEILQFEQGI